MHPEFAGRAQLTCAGGHLPKRKKKPTARLPRFSMDDPGRRKSTPTETIIIRELPPPAPPPKHRVGITFRLGSVEPLKDGSELRFTWHGDHARVTRVMGEEELERLTYRPAPGEAHRDGDELDEGLFSIYRGSQEVLSPWHDGQVQHDWWTVGHLRLRGGGRK
jgi:hypothetical protein